MRGETIKNQEIIGNINLKHLAEKFGGKIEPAGLIPKNKSKEKPGKEYGETRAAEVREYKMQCPQLFTENRGKIKFTDQGQKITIGDVAIYIAPNQLTGPNAKEKKFQEYSALYFKNGTYQAHNTQSNEYSIIEELGRLGIKPITT